MEQIFDSHFNKMSPNRVTQNFYFQLLYDDAVISIAVKINKVLNFDVTFPFLRG